MMLLSQFKLGVGNSSINCGHAMNATSSGSPTDAAQSDSLLSIQQRLAEKKSWIVQNASCIKIGDVKRELERDLSLPNGHLDDARAAAVVMACVDAILIEELPRILEARVRAGAHVSCCTL